MSSASRSDPARLAPGSPHVGQSERPVIAAWHRRLEGALALLAPGRCHGCSQRIAGGPAASDSSRRLPERFCARCEAGLGLEPRSRAPLRAGRMPWPVYASLRYAGTGEEWVRRIKYPAPGLAGLDGDARGLLFALARDVTAVLPRPDAIVPVPLHRSAYVRREFNPALLWARALARATAAPVWPRALTKLRPTRPQKGLGVAARRANVADAFVAHPRGAASLQGSPLVLLVDDVVTTGATLEACIRALRAGGLARPGIAVCLARTPALRGGDDTRAAGSG